MSDIEGGHRSLEAGRQAERLGDLAEARRCWHKAAEAASGDVPLQLLVIEALASAGLQGEADTILSRALARFPDNIWIARLAPLATQRKGDWEGALVQWRALVETFPREGIAYIGFAEALRHLGRLEEAETMAQQGTSGDPGFPWLYDLHATLAESRGAWDEAEARWQVIRSRFPEHGRSYASLARIKAQAGQLDQVETILRSGVEALPNDAELVCALLSNLVDQEKVEAAADLIRDRGAVADRDDRFYPLIARAFVKFAAHPSADAFVQTLLRQPWTVERQWLPAIVGPFAIALARQDRTAGPAEERIRRVLASDERTRVEEYVAVWLNFDRITDEDRRRVVERLIRDGQVSAVLALSQDAVQNENDLSRYGIRETVAEVVRDLCDAADDGLSDGSAFALLVLSFRFQPKSFRSLLERVPPAFGPAIERWFRPIARPVEAPALVPKRLRIAVCVSGQLRGYRAALATWAKLGLDAHDVHYFVHAWKDVGRKLPVSPSSGSGSPNLFAAYSRFMHEIDNDLLRRWYPSFFSQELVTEAELYDLYKADRVVVDDDTLPPFAAMNNSEKMHYKIHAAGRLAREAGDFDLVIRIRPDKEVAASNADWIDLLSYSERNDTIFVDRGKVSDGHFNLLIGDQFAFGTQRLMQIYEDTYNFQTESWAVRRPLFGPPHQAHISLALTCFYQAVDVEAADTIRFGRLLDAQARSPALLLQALQHDIGPVPRNHADSALLAAARADVAALGASMR
ncbi:hypothetical protein [Methylobacterium sp. J-068]|uniref:tetratricopeptide repeat protein n=1 Tax=Methylobacterium sp. J-068 TaxID=2836649 RepID=UPI001FB96518|nr:hypothetical protein [Methylobacterium sp. J-068]MCJ2037040.1 hypothetical protein [Methylobacterium sp. J-068]